MLSGIDIKDVINEIYQQSLVLGLTLALSMVLQKFFKISLGTPMSFCPLLMLAVSLSIGASLLKFLEDKWKIPTEPFGK